MSAPRAGLRAMRRSSRAELRAPPHPTTTTPTPGAEHGQLESALAADTATAKGLEQTIADTEKAQAKARAELKKAEVRR